MNHFRTIALCNVTAKLITEIVANHFIPLMDKLVSPNQASFIRGRQVSDNMIILQEVIHSIRRKKRKKGSMAIKVDLEKAYHSVNLGFLEKILKVVGFEEKLNSLIMFCIKSTKLSLV